jgi:hypothetical protein
MTFNKCFGRKDAFLLSLLGIFDVIQFLSYQPGKAKHLVLKQMGMKTRCSCRK